MSQPLVLRSNIVAGQTGPLSDDSQRAAVLAGGGHKDGSSGEMVAGAKSFAFYALPRGVVSMEGVVRANLRVVIGERERFGLEMRQ